MRELPWLPPDQISRRRPTGEVCLRLLARSRTLTSVRARRLAGPVVERCIEVSQLARGAFDHCVVRMKPLQWHTHVVVDDDGAERHARISDGGRRANCILAFWLAITSLTGSTDSASCATTSARLRVNELTGPRNDRSSSAGCWRCHHNEPVITSWRLLRMVIPVRSPCPGHVHARALRTSRPLRAHQLLHFLQVRERVGLGSDQLKAGDDGVTLRGWSDLEVLDQRGVELRRAGGCPGRR